MTPLWTPSDERIESSNITRFTKSLAHSGKEFRTYKELWEWSVTSPEEFWPHLAEFTGVQFTKRGTKIVTNREQLPGAKWFEDFELNFAQHLLSRRDDEEALIFYSENGARRSLSFSELYRTVLRLQQALIAQGVGVGDRVAGFLPNMPESIAAMLAATSLGAVWSSTSPDFGVSGVLERFLQIEPKVLFVADTYYYNGKQVDSFSKVPAIVSQIPSLERVIVLPYNGLASTIPSSTLSEQYKLMEELPAGYDGEVVFASLPFNHPLYIMYSSGTTGVPKCIVHGAGGTLLQHLKELVLHSDLKREDRIFYFTTCGWMMWNWVISSLAVGSSVVLFDGSPFHPSGEILWEMAEKERIAIFGASAKYLLSCEKAEIAPIKKFPLQSLKAILSTGSPLPPSSFEYVYRSIKKDVCLSSISGGTDIISCFALGNPTLPVFSGELQCRGLGMRVEVFDESGASVQNEKGELVCTASFPSMPIYFWNDPEGKKYFDSYFAVYPNVWRHGDWVELTERGGLIFFGRSDAVLNPGGVRIGTAEIYRQVEQLPEILESLVTSQEWDNDERVVLFVKLKPELTLDSVLEERIRKTIRSELTPRHVPAKILQVADIPKTISGKITELAVKNVIHNRNVKNVDALANPQSLEFFKNRVELQS